MLTTYFFILLLSLSLLKCASTEDQSEAIQAKDPENPSKTDIFSRHLDDRLLHRILEYDTKSTGRMAKANRALKKLANGSRTFRFFEGAGWDMPELANVCEFGVTDIRNRPQLKAEIAKIMALSHIKDETVFNETLDKFLFKEKIFKELAGPVLKYLIRRFYARNEHLNDKDGAKRQRYLLFAVKNRFYDVFFDLTKDPDVWYNSTLEDIILCNIDESFYFDCYNKYVFDNRIAREFMFNKVTAIDPTDYSYCSTPSEGKLSRSELSAWIAVCIYRRVPEEKYAPYLSMLPVTFLDIIEEYIYKYSPITSDIKEKEYYQKFINSLLDKYLTKNKDLEDVLSSIRLSNGIRFRLVHKNY